MPLLYANNEYKKITIKKKKKCYIALNHNQNIMMFIRFIIFNDSA